MNRKYRLFGYNVDALRMQEAVDTALSWITESSGTCRYVVTPNVDHTVMFQEREDLRRAYADASMILADGMPVVLASRLVGKPLPERVTGTDLVYAIFDAVQKGHLQSTQALSERVLMTVGGSADAPAERVSEALFDRNADTAVETKGSKALRVFLLGAGSGVAAEAAANIEGRWSAVEVVGTYSPPMGFERDPQENFQILRRISMANPDVLIVGLGAPKQELWVHTHWHEIKASAALCVGAAIDFLAGEKPRAPRWMQRAGLEWFHRLCSEPKLLAKRYSRDAWIFPRIVWREWRNSRRDE